ncbi:hypothetical protein BJV82DRAFT_659365 [Fennellomyces sp. T-0311]|nr:hypothetical protein BJV82DRAFT_659365 [Fennellomyces sp. T-0311]
MLSISSDIQSSSPEHQFTFVDAFPSEITTSIISHLSQDDTLNCMATCRSWYSLVPRFAQQVWETVSIKEHHIRRLNRRREQCLGDHVKTLIFSQIHGEETLYEMMQRAIGWGCTKISSLELSYCTTEDQDAFLGILQQWRPHLTRFKMTHHGSNVAFRHILTLCPELTHFSYQQYSRAWVEHDVYDQDPDVHTPVPLSNDHPNLVYLWLDMRMNARLRLDPILKNCPNLRSLTLRDHRKDMHIDHTDANYEGAPFEDLLTWCPRLAFFQTAPAYTFVSRSLKKHVQQCSYDDVDSVGKLDGLRQLGISGDNGRDRIAQILTKYQDTMERLLIQRHDIDENWSSVFHSLFLPHLRLFACEQLQFDAPPLISMLNHCPSLATLVIQGTPLVFNQSVLSAMFPMRHLHTLHLDSLVIEDDTSITMMFEQLPVLEMLHLVSSLVPLTILAYAPYLKQLYMYEVEWKYPETG